MVFAEQTLYSKDKIRTYFFLFLLVKDVFEKSFPKELNYQALGLHQNKMALNKILLVYFMHHSFVYLV